MKAKISGVIVAALIAAQFFFVATYIQNEQTIYYWDHAMYFNLARQAYDAFAHDFDAGWAVFHQSLGDNYNLIYALPSLAAFALFGDSRLIFILTNFAVFFLAYEIAVAFLLRRILKCDWGLALIISLASGFLIPPLWLPLLEGYPDSGAAACLVFAAALGLSPPQRWPLFLHGLVVGIILGFGVLLRRHFAYPALALLTALACFALWDAWRTGKNRQRELRQFVFYFAAAGVGFVGLIELVAPDFLHSAVTVDYGALYFSYKRPAVVFVYFLLGGFGFGLLLAAGSGLAYLAHKNKAGERLAGFTGLFAFLWLIIWCAGPDQMGHHYVLHALPFLISVGLAGWVLYFTSPAHKKYAPLGVVLALLLAANSAWALWLSPTGVWPNDNGTPGLLSAARPPVVRQDYDEWLRLADYLRQTARPEDRIMMIGSSFIFNQDLLHSVYVDILKVPDAFARFVRAPEIDHEEPAPFNPFAAATIYVVPMPAQYHLDPAGQRVVTAAAKQFPPPAPRAAMFHEDKEAFHLADGVIVRIWRRDAWTPARLHEALGQIRRDGPQDKNFIQDWATLDEPLQAQIRTDERNYSLASGVFGPAGKTMRLFFDYPLMKGGQRLAFRLAGNCPALALHLQVVTGDGHVQIEKDIAPDMTGETAQSFSVPAKPDTDRFLELVLTANPAALCQVQLRDLRVELQP